MPIILAVVILKGCDPMVRPYQRKETGGGSFQLQCVVHVYIVFCRFILVNEIPIIVIKKLRKRCAEEKLSKNCVIDIPPIISTLQYAYSFICVSSTFPLLEYI